MMQWQYDVVSTASVEEHSAILQKPKPCEVTNKAHINCCSANPIRLSNLHLKPHSV